jgi:hypothetical protein
MAPLMIALAYEAIFRKPVSTIFSGMYVTVKQAVEKDIAALEADLRRDIIKGRAGRVNAKKLEWINARRGEA